MPNEIDMGAFEWFGKGYLTYGNEIKFYVGANIGPDEDNDTYLTAENFEHLAEEAKRIANELRGLTLRAVDPPSALVGGGDSENSAGN